MNLTFLDKHYCFGCFLLFQVKMSSMSEMLTHLRRSTTLFSFSLERDTPGKTCGPLNLSIFPLWSQKSERSGDQVIKNASF